MIMISDKIVSYKFGPQCDMDIRFSAAFQMQVGMPYEECHNASRLLFQLLCHAVQQLQSVEKKCWTLEKIEEIGSWEYPDKKAVLEHKPVHIIRPMTYAKYQIKVDGRVVLTLRESSTCDFVIDYFDFYDPRETDGGWYDMVFDCAYEHCRRFGRH